MTLARRERAAFCDLAEKLGPDAPTLCRGWTTRDMAVHLLVVGGHPLATAGYVVKKLQPLTRRAERYYQRTDYALLIDQVRRSWIGIEMLGRFDKWMAPSEYFAHHEDIRRAQPGWEPRSFSDEDEQLMWGLLSIRKTLIAKQCRVPVTARSRLGEIVIKPGEGGVTIVGDPGEVLLRSYGRLETRVEIEGSSEALATFQEKPIRL